VAILGTDEAQSNTAPYVNAYRSLDRIATATETDSPARRLTTLQKLGLWARLAFAAWVLVLGSVTAYRQPSLGMVLSLMITWGLVAGTVGANAVWGLSGGWTPRYRGRFRKGRKRA
jgi:hypothetical protein